MRTKNRAAALRLITEWLAADLGHGDGDWERLQFIVNTVTAEVVITELARQIQSLRNRVTALEGVPRHNSDERRQNCPPEIKSEWGRGTGRLSGYNVEGDNTDAKENI
jgi:acyl dehydratase